MGRALALGLTAFVVSSQIVGCGAREIYDWGAYEELLYQSFVEPGKADPLTQLERLTRQIQRTEARGRRIPPGVRVQVGYLHSQLGQAAEAAEYFRAEKAFFPESTVFVDGILERMNR